MKLRGEGGMVKAGMCGEGGMHGRGACMTAGMCGRGHTCRRDGHKSGRYASYWNAFLFVKVFDANIGNLV